MMPVISAIHSRERILNFMNNTPELAPLMTIEQISDHLQIHSDTLRAWVKAKSIPHIRIGAGSRTGQRATIRFELHKVLEWLSSMEVAPDLDALRGVGK